MGKIVVTKKLYQLVLVVLALIIITASKRYKFDYLTGLAIFTLVAMVNYALTWHREERRPSGPILITSTGD